MNRKFLLFPLLMVLFAPLAMAQTTLYSEDFENGSIPSGWTQEGPGTWVVTSGDHSTSTGAGQGTYNALCDHTSRNNVTKLITSEIDLSSVASAELSFMHIQRAWGSDIDALRVYYRTSNSGTWTTLVEYTNAYASWTTESGIVLPYLSATYQLAFECTDNYGYGVGLDDIIIIQGSSCPNPTGLTYEVTSTGYHFSWDPETGASFQYSKTLAGEMPSWWLDTGHDGSDNYFDYPFDELESNADVLFWVRKKCSDDEFSNYAYIGFHTPCDAITSFPWAEDFEGYASGNFTDPCWVNEHISGDGTQIFKVYTSTTGNNSTHQLQLPDMSQGTMTKLVLPKMALPGDDYEFVIDVYRSNSTYNSSNIYEGIRVFVSTNGEIEGATELAFIPRQYNTENEVIPAEEAIGWYNYELPIGISGTCYIILQGESQYCTSTFMDNFQVKQTPTCLHPTGLAMTQSATGYHFTWNAEADATFEYSITPAGETPTAWLETGNNGSDNYLDCLYSALSPNTDLVFWVHKKCGANDYSDPVSVEFRTPCEAIATFPWTEDFTGLTAGIPDCWDNTEGTTTDESYRWSYYDAGHDSAPCLRFDSYYNNTNNTNFLKTPVLNFPTNTVMQLSFWYKNPSGGDFSVYISTDGGTTYTTSLATGLTDASDWTNMEIDLVEYTNAQGVVIVFKGTSNYGYDDAYIYLDEVIVREAPDCMHPTGLTMAQLTTGYHFTWDAEADATFEYSITPAGETPTGWLETGNNGNDNYVDCPFSTFDPSADVIFWVHKKCGSDEFSDPVSVGFHTPCSAYAVTDENYIYDFETSEPMDCWRALSGDIERYENSNNAYSGDYHLRFSGSSLSRIITLPLFEEATNTLRLELYTRPEGYTYPSCGTFDIGYMTNLDDANSFVPVETYSYDEWSSNTYEKKTINFTDAPADAYIALRHNAFSSPYYWYVDDVTVRLAPDCLEPSGVQLQEGSLTAHGATFEWDALEGEYFQFAVLEGIVTDFSSVTWSEAIQNDHAELTASLNPESDYTFVIRKYCSATNQSEPVALNFHTLEACPAPTELEVTDVAAHSATIDWTGTSQNQNYKVWYRKAAGISPVLTEDFEDEGTFNARWTVVNMSTENENRIGLDYYAAHQGSYGFRFSSWSNSNTYEEYLINKNALTGITEGSVIEFYYMKYASSPYESFKVGYSSTNNETSSFTFGDEHEATGEWQLFQETIPVGTKYVAIRYTTTDCNYYLYIDDIAIGQPVAAGSWNYDETTEIPYTIHGLTPETLYEAYIQGLCGSDGDSDPSETVTFTTTEDCPMPVNFTASNLTTTSADLSWEGISEVESYTVRYRTAEQIQGFNEHFDNSDLPGGWTRYSGILNDDGTATSTNGNTGWFFGTYNNVFENHAYINLYAQKSYWLVTPSITIGNGYYLNFDLAYTSYYGTNAAPVPNCTTHRFVVLISTDNEHWTILREYNNSGSSYVLDEISPYGQNAGAISLANYVGQTVHIAFFAHSESSEYDNNLHIDNVGIGQIIAAGAWQTVTVSGTNSVEAGTTLTGLTANTIYESQVKSDCSNNAWSEQIRFTTLPYKRFVTTGDWNVDSNWEPAGVPETGDDVIVDAAAVIPASYVANVGHITLGTNGAITIKDGGQLRHTNASTDGVTVTLEKEITGYGTSTDADHYYFIAPAPFIQTISPNSVVNLKTNDYDFYSFYAAASDGLEWINLHESTTSLKSAHGYLYANSEDVTLKSTGPAISITGGAALSIQYDPTDNYSYNGWNLAGNPYVCNGYVKVTKNNEIVETDFYRMNSDGDGYDLITSADALAPYEGVLVFIEGEQGQYEIGFSPDPIASNSGKLNMNLSRNGKRIDMARVRFGRGQNLGKMTFRDNSSKVFIPMDGKDYAMVYSEGNMGEMPVSFKAERNGSYTLSFTNEDVTFSYLHLIDNLTGVETDLLENPSYSFEASTTDYTQRFRLVFTTGTSVDGDNFGFVNASGNLCIFGIEGEATVQVIDILGHVISSETFSGSYEKKINGAPGVYVIRLINGNDVKVQKVVVR